MLYYYFHKVFFSVNTYSIYRTIVHFQRTMNLISGYFELGLTEGSEKFYKIELLQIILTVLNITVSPSFMILKV